jgi:hypothetical protein
MKKLILIQILCLSLFSIAYGQKNSIENGLYQISIPADFSKNPRFIVIHKASAAIREVMPKIHVVFSEAKPELLSAAVDGYNGVIRWKTSDGKVDLNIFNLVGKDIIANKVELENGKLVFSFPVSSYGKLSLQVLLPQANESPSFVMGIDAAKNGWYSLGFTGITPKTPEKLDFLYQPLVWSWKRFPSQPCITEESHATTAAVFINSNGFSEGIAPATEMIPYRYALSANWSNKAGKKLGSKFAYTKKTGNSLFGLSLRNNEGLAQPMVFAPLFGGEGSYIPKHHNYSFTCKYLFTPGDWLAGSEFLLYNICKYKNERQNGTVTLNQTLDNMIAFGMNDSYSGWMDEYKGFDYRFDGPGTVKVVSALHALGIALTTGDYEVYKRRALPLIEYMMSRQKYLFAYDTLQKTQAPSYELKGPCAEIGELAGLHLMTNGNSSVFEKETERIFGKPRKLNLNTLTGGASWQDYMARYKITGNADDLKKATENALIYVEQNVKSFPTSFTSSAGLKDKQAAFQIDFTSNIYDLFELWELTKVKVFLEAARIGARHLALWARSNPMAPDSVITVNEGGVVEGIFPGRRQGTTSHDFVPRDESTRIAEQKIPAWRTSLVGLVPEQHSTYTYGPIMLSHHAAWFLRIAGLTGDKVLADAAYNAVLGRYANFPGYYFTSLYTNVYQMPDYTMRDFDDVHYNAIFYNHVWPHIALINDFLISDAFYRSDGKVDFPSVYAPGFAYLTSKVYGNKPGTVFGNEKVRLWLPAKALQTSNVAFNHLFGVSDNAFYVVLMNTSKNDETTTIQLNQDKVTYDSGRRYSSVIYSSDGKKSNGEVLDGKFSISVSAGGLVAVKIQELVVDIPLFSDYDKMQDKTSAESKNYFRETGESPFIGNLTGMMINLTPEFSDCYIYSDVLETKVRKATLNYKIGEGAWQKQSDAIYPYEFSIRLTVPKQKLIFKWVSEGKDGSVFESKQIELSN